MEQDEAHIVRVPLVEQVVVVVVLASIGTYMLDPFNHRSAANLFWMVGVPAAIGVGVNSGYGRRGLVTALLVLASMLTTIIIEVGFNS